MTVKAGTKLSELSNEERNAISFLQSRDIRENHKDYPHNALHLFPKRSLVQAFNDAKIKSIPDCETIHAIDTKKDETGSISKDSVKHDLDDKGLL